MHIQLPVFGKKEVVETCVCGRQAVWIWSISTYDEGHADQQHSKLHVYMLHNSSIHLYIYIPMYIYTCVYAENSSIHLYIYIPICIYMCTCGELYTYIHAHIYYVDTYCYISIHIYICRYQYTYIYKYTHIMSTYIDVYMNIYVYIHFESRSRSCNTNPSKAPRVVHWAYIRRWI